MKYKLSPKLGPSTWFDLNRTCADMGQYLLAVQSKEKDDSLPESVKQSR